MTLDGPNVAGITVDHTILWLNDGDSVWKQDVAGYHHDNVIHLEARNTHLFNDWRMTLRPGEVLADPLFKDRAGRDFTLLPGSPAVRMGAK